MTKRVHEIALMDKLGRVWVREFFRPNLLPYTQDIVFKPTKTLESSPIPEAQFGKELVLKAKNVVAARGKGKL